MMRLLLTILLPFLLPILTFLVYAVHQNRKNPHKPVIIPWGWLFVLGGALAGITILAVELTNQSAKDVNYQPSRLIDGQIIPGTLTPKDEAREIK